MNRLGSYYDNTVSFLTDECGIGSYSVATGKAVLYGLGGGLWRDRPAANGGFLRRFRLYHQHLSPFVYNDLNKNIGERWLGSPAMKQCDVF